LVEFCDVDTTQSCGAGVTESTDEILEPVACAFPEPEPVDSRWNTPCGVDEKQSMTDSNPLGDI
jgi:hypothetical protein